MIKYCFLVLALLFATFFKTKRSLHMLQQNLYNENNRYLKWVFKNPKQFVDMDFLMIVIALCGSFLFYDIEKLAFFGITGLIVIGYLLGFCWIKRIKSDQNKKPLVVTARIKRLIFTISVLYFIPLCFMSYFQSPPPFRAVVLF